MHSDDTISIHALREEGDAGRLLFLSMLCYFYPRPPRGGRLGAVTAKHGVMQFLSTPSARRATRRTMASALASDISIHALREEGDHPASKHRPRHCHFYPRPPRGGRRLVSQRDTEREIFLSTPSARRATRIQTAETGRKVHFYPRPPRGGRQQKQRQNLYFQTNYTTFCTNLEEP